MFDFRHGRSTRRLLSDRKRDNWQAVGKKLVYYSNKLYMILSNSSAQGKKRNKKKLLLGMKRSVLVPRSMSTFRCVLFWQSCHTC